MKPFEVIPVTTWDVACGGEAGPLGHPRVYLHIDQFSHKIQCPYCSRLYVLEDAGLTDDKEAV